MNTALRSASVLALLAAALHASAQTTVFYGGDFDGYDGLRAERNGPADDTPTVYDDIILTHATSVTSLFGDYEVTNGGVLGLGYEIRQGMSAGNGGTLLATGIATGISTTRIGNAFDSPLDRILGSVSGLTPGIGTYYLGLYPLMNGDSDAYLTTTSGANAVGLPIDDGNAYFYDDTGNYSYVSTTDSFGSGVHDFSIGLVGQATPEPCASAVLGLGAVAVLRRRKRA